jgi:hypothetical protein
MEGFKMKYCVIKNTTTIIDGSDNSDEVMAQNAQNAGITDFEILTEEEYQVRKANDPVPPEVEIEKLKTQLTETDYKIIKCSEYQLAGQPLPYDIQALHTERQALRDQINTLETTPV